MQKHARKKRNVPSCEGPTVFHQKPGSQIKFTQTDKIRLIHLAEDEPNLLRLIIFEIACGGRMVISTDEALSEGSLYELIPGGYDVEKQAIAKDQLSYLDAALKKLHPLLEQIIRLRMAGKSFESIVPEFKMTRERIRQLHIKAQFLLLMDPEIRQLAGSKNGTLGEDLEFKAKVMNYLSSLGFSNAFITKWGIRGFPNFIILRAAAVSITEVLYPICMIDGMREGQDRLDIKKFNKFLKSVKGEALRKICKSAEITSISENVRKYICSIVEKKQEKV